MAQTADAIYGFDPSHVAPTASPAPMHMGAPEPSIDTRGPASKGSSPLVALLVLIAIAIVLTQVSFRGAVEVKA